MFVKLVFVLGFLVAASHQECAQLGNLGSGDAACHQEFQKQMSALDPRDVIRQARKGNVQDSKDALCEVVESVLACTSDRCNEFLKNNFQHSRSKTYMFRGRSKSKLYYGECFQ